MSHFVVLVIGDDHKQQLAPYREYECAGEVDSYVVSVDETAKMRAEYEAATVRRMRAPDSTLHECYADRFYREPTAEERKTIGPIAGTGAGGGLSWASKDWGNGQGYSSRVHFIPDGWTEVTDAAKDVQSFLDWVVDYTGRPMIEGNAAPDLEAAHKWGWVRVRPAPARRMTLRDETQNVIQVDRVVEVIDRTNPDAKWDWYSIGGRWSGYFMLKQGTKGVVGEPGAFDNVAPVGHADQCRWGDVDIDGMCAAAALAAGPRYDGFHAIVRGRPIPVWDPSSELTREQYRQDPVTKDIRASREYTFANFDDFRCARAVYVQRAADSALVPFAVLKEGKWAERGSMGWFGFVAGEKNQDAWNKEVQKLLRGLSPDTLVTAVDCHI